MKPSIFETDEAYIELKKRRKELRLSQDDIAKLVGITQASISMFENGEIALDYMNYFALLRALRINVRFKFDNRSTRKSAKRDKDVVV